MFIPCNACSLNITYCEICISGYFLYKNKCYASCTDLNDQDNGKYYGKDTNDECKICSDPNCIDCSSDYSKCNNCSNKYNHETSHCILRSTSVFTKSHVSTLSKAFSEPKRFTKSSNFSSSVYFTKSSDFSNSVYFTKSEKFLGSSEFSDAFVFTESSQFLKFSPFSDSLKFSNSAQFTESTEFSSSYSFTGSNLFNSAFFNNILMFFLIHSLQIERTNDINKKFYSNSIQTNLSSEIDRLKSQIISLRQEIDKYNLRLKHSKNAIEELNYQLKTFLKKPLPDAVIFERHKYEQMVKQIDDISKAEIVQNYLFQAYETILNKINQKGETNNSMQNEVKNEKIKKSKLNLRNDSDLLTYNTKNSPIKFSEKYSTPNRKQNYRRSLITRSAPVNKNQLLRKSMNFISKLNAKNIKKSLEKLSNTKNTQKSSPILFIAKSLNCNELNGTNHIFNITNESPKNFEEENKWYKTEIFTTPRSEISPTMSEEDFQIMELTGQKKSLTKEEIKRKMEEEEEEEEEETIEDEFRKEIKKDFVENSNFVDLNENQNMAIYTQEYMKSEEEKALGKYPVIGHHLDNHDQIELTELCSLRLKNCLAIEKTIVRFFGTLEPKKIMSILYDKSIQNNAMSESEIDIREKTNELTYKHEKFTTMVQEATTDNNGMERLISEGKKIREKQKILLKEKNKELKELLMQNKAIMKGIIKIAGIFEMKIDEGVDQFQRVKDIVQVVSHVFQENREILLGFRYMQMTNKLSLKNNFDSTSSLRVTFSNAPKLNIPSLNVLSSTPQFESSAIAPAQRKKSLLSSTSKFDASMQVPNIALNSTNLVKEYIPGTRNSRRAFSAANSHRNNRMDQDDVDQELSLIGMTMGRVLVERFAPEFIEYKEKICLQEHDEISFDVDDKIEEKLKTFTTFIEYLKSLFGLYKRYRSYLYLLLYEVEEVKQIDRSFIKFLSKRNQYINFLNKKKFLDGHVFVQEVYDFLSIDEYVSLWVIHDVVINTKAKIMIPQLIQKISPVFQRLQSKITNNMDREQAFNYVPWISCFTIFLDFNKMTSTHESIANLCNNNLSKLIPIFYKSQSTAKFRAGLLTFFRFGCYLPHLFTIHIQFQNKATSILHSFIMNSLNFPSCVKASTDFFVASWSLLDQEIIMWHTAAFYHLIINEIVHQPLRDFNLNRFIAVMTLIVANRQKFTMDQLVKLNFLSFLICNFHLEEMVDLEKVQEVSESDLKLPKKSMAIIPESLRHRNVSYLDLPLFKMEDQEEDDENNPLIPSKNMENPKLQLHFQPKADEKMQKLASKKMKISAIDYINKRKKYPIYATLELHCNFIQMVFATLIDHSLHRLDIFFCDPFPQVNRKPNVLYTLMKHMEMEENSDIVKPLEKAFTPYKENQQYQTSNSNFSAISEYSEDELSQRKDNEEEEEEDDDDDDDDDANIRLNQNENFSSENYDNKIFKSIPNFIADSKIDDMVIGSSVRRSSRIEATKEAFRRDRMAQFLDYQRLLRMVVPFLFNPSNYMGGTYIASGAFGSVNAVTLNGQLYAVKVLSKSKHEFDNPHLNDVYTEVSILENCKGDRRVTQLYDYGTTNDSYYIVMEFYPMTLKSWRKKYNQKKKKPSEQTLLRLFREFLNSATVLTDKRINHFDIKCDNVMLDHFGFPALADFGESMSYKNDTNCITLLNKGTEWIKSPEMLSIALNSSATNPNYDRRKRVGAGPESDIWSIGCLFFELMTGEFLFVDSDWSRFFLRITDPKEKLITDESFSLLNNNKQYQAFLEFVLQREVTHRPNLRQVIEKFDKIFPDSLNGPLPKIEMPNFNFQ